MSHKILSHAPRRPRCAAGSPRSNRLLLLLSVVAVLGAAGLAAAGLAAAGLGVPPAGAASAEVPIPPPRPGGRIAFESDRSGNYEIYTMNADGTGVSPNLTRDPAYDGTPAISPDGTRIAFTSDRHASGGIYVMNADGTGQSKRLTRDDANDIDPAFSSDGRQVAFAGYRDDSGWNIYVTDADGDGPLQRVTNEESGAASRPTFSPDGEWIAYTVAYGDSSERQIYRIRVDGSGRQRLTFEGSSWDAAYSPDGNHIAFASDRLGNAEIYTMTDGGRDQRNVTDDPAGDDEEPAFSPDGQGIVFTSDRDDDPGDDEYRREIYVMDVDGSNQGNLTKRGQADDTSSSWGESLPCMPGPEEIAIYEHASYQGRCVVRGVGTYNNLLEFYPLRSETASSIRVGADVRVRLARDNNLKGRVETFTADDGDLTGNAIGDDTMSSFKVEPAKATVKVMLIVIDPILRSRGNQRLSKFMTWQNPDELTNRFMLDLADASHGTADYHVTRRIDVNWWPKHKNGSSYTDDLYLWDYHNDPDHWLLGDGDYSALIRTFKITQAVQQGDVDEVFIWGYPGDGFAESAMAGTNAFDINGDPITDVPTNPFVFMGFNYERGVAEAAESYGHRVEFMMEKVYQLWNPEDNDWERFTTLDRDRPGRGGLGNAHNAFNAKPCASPCDPWDGRDRDSPRQVSTSAKDWYNFPNMTGERATANCSEWGCCPDPCDNAYKYLKWWYHHMAHVRGTKSGVLNNWWYYIVDPSTVLGFRT
jgi:Tol biopolymer transport system component